MSKILFVGCGKRKRDVESAAAELYCGPLFEKRLAFARSTGDSFLILSARHGLLNPGTIIAPYDATLSQLSPLDQIAWSVGVVRQLVDLIDNDTLSFRSLRDIHCEIHAGQDYAARLSDLLRAAGFSASWPVEGMSQGRQMNWYAERLPR